MVAYFNPFLLLNKHRFATSFCILYHIFKNRQFIPNKFKASLIPTMRLIAVLSILFFLNMQACLAQLTSLGTVNVSGESVSITTIDNSNLLVTNSLLQFNVENQPEANLVNSFLPDEIRVYPNPVVNILDINILHANKGKHQIELLDAIGLKIKEQQLNYTSDNSD